MMEKIAGLADRIGKIFGEGDVVFQQGDAGDTMDVIHSGALAVIRETEGTSTVVARLNPGDFVGEMALVDQEPRSANGPPYDEPRSASLLKSFSDSLRRKVGSVSFWPASAGATFSVRWLSSRASPGWPQLSLRPRRCSCR